MPQEEIPLREVPNRFFNGSAWALYLRQFQSRSQALKVLSTFEMPSGLSASSQQIIIVRLRRSLFSELKIKLISREVASTGILEGDDERSAIPGDHWDALWPNFAENRADSISPQFPGYTDVLIVVPGAKKSATASLLDECRSWLQQRGEEGESVKKILARRASKQFGSDLTTRMFDAAYKDVFGKVRGRPRKTR